MTYAGSAVPVVDSIVTNESEQDMYVILGSQTTVETSNFDSFDFRATINIDITHKSGYSASKDGVDNVAQQIFNIIQPTVKTNGLIPQTGVQFSNVRKIADNYLSFTLANVGNVVRRIVTYEVLVHQL